MRWRSLGLVLRDVLQLSSNKMTLDHLRLVIMVNALPDYTGDREDWDACLCLAKGGPVRQVVGGTVNVSLLVTDDHYPSLIINGYLAARDAAGHAYGVPQTLWVACHRFM